jgi:transketolase
MKFNLFKAKAEAMAAADPTGATTLAPTATPALASTAADLSGSNNTEISKNDMFEEIKSKFLNEIDKIPREFLSQCSRSLRRVIRRRLSLLDVMETVIH